MIAEAVAKATAPLIERIAALEAELAKAKKNSSNSSKPPSSDMVKPPRPSAKDGKKRKRGAQPGHQQHLHPVFPPEAVNHFEAHISKPTRWIVAPTAAVRFGLPSVRPMFCNKSKSPKRRRSSPSIKAWPTGARIAESFITRRCRMRSSKRDCSAHG
jgi:hypothetical protein